MTDKKRRNKRIVTSMMLTLMVSALVGGIAVADRNIRRMGFGDDRPIIGMTSEDGKQSLEFCLMGQTYTIDVTGVVNLARQAKEDIGHLLGSE